MRKYTSFNPSKSIKDNDKSTYFSTNNQIIMGILNITDDSFYDGGKYKTENQIINHVKSMLDEGATIIDIGAQSSRPGAQPIKAQYETDRLLPVIKLLKNTFPNIIISIDTYWSEVAKKCVNIGADMINDISAGEIDDKMFDAISELQVPYILMHMKGTPDNMQKNPSYKNVTNEIISFFDKKIKMLKIRGVKNIIIDPGFGFGKKTAHNFQLLNELLLFKKFNMPILVGLSRKSMICNIIEQDSEDTLNGTSIANTIALKNGANILRVHDVKEAMECIKITRFTENIR